MRLSSKLLQLVVITFTGMVLFSSCAKDDLANPTSDLQIDERGPITGFINTPLIGLRPGNLLVNLLSGPPAVELGTVPISGLRDGENIIAIDIRPKTGQLFGVSDLSYLYLLDPVTGAATAVSVTEFVPKLEGDTYGVDFDPSLDQLRIISSTGQNLRVSPVTGSVVGVDPALGQNGVRINGIAYTPYNSLSRLVMYSLDLSTNALYRTQTTGGFELVGPTGFTWTGEGGFEISSGYQAFAVEYGNNRFQTGPLSTDNTYLEAYRLYNINLRTGKATSFGIINRLIGLAAR